VRSIFAATGGVLRDLEALVLPVSCLGCGTYLPPREAGDGCCAICRSRMRRLSPPACTRCGQPVDPWDAGKKRTSGPVTAGGSRPRDPAAAQTACGFCRGWPDALAWAGSAVWLEEGPARDLVHALKYGGWRVAAAPMAEAMAAALAGALRPVDLLLPVPLGARRLRERGYNQAAVLARALADRLGKRVEVGALARSRETRSQTTLAPTERWRNVQGAFVAAGDLSGTRVAVVDDVLTTGATLAACAAALASGGVAAVGAATFARAAVPN
jgi:ComF family protein